MKILRMELLIDYAWLAFAGSYCIVASTYPTGGRLVPLAVGLVAVAVGLVHLSGNFIAFMRSSTHGDTKAEELSVDIDHSQLKAVLWATLLLSGIFFVGALAAIFLFFVVYFVVCGRRWILGLTSAVLMTFLTWGLFGQLMSFELPHGIITELIQHSL